MLDGIVPEDVTPDYLRSYYQQRVALGNIAPVFENLIPQEDQDLIPDIQEITQRLIEPTLDASRFPEGVMQNATKLSQLFRLEQDAQDFEHDVFQGLADKYIDDPETLSKILEYVIRIGQMVKAGAAHAHNNVVDDSRPERDHEFEEYMAGRGLKPDISAIIPDSVEGNILGLIEVAGLSKWDEFKSALALPWVRLVSTAHPTRYFTSAFTEGRLGWGLSMRELTRRVAAGDWKAFYDYASGASTSKAFQDLKEWFAKPITFKNEKGEVANMTPYDEIIAAMMDASDDFNRNIDEVFRTFDDALQRLSDAGMLPFVYGEAERLDMMLSMDFSTWVMGDKDGNNNLRSEHLLMATLIFRQRAAKNYMEQLKKSGLDLRRDDGTLWQDYFEAKQAEMGSILAKLQDRIKAKGNGIDLPLTRAEFLEAKKAAEMVYGDINAVNAQFQTALSAAYTNSRGKPKKQALSMLRKSRIMGLGLLKIQLRETAEMYTPVIDTLLKGDTKLFNGNIQNYASPEMDYDAKLALLNMAITQGANNPAALAQLKDNFFARLKREGKDVDGLRNYILPKANKSDPDEIDGDVITAHTLQRFEVGTMQDGLITDHILAECTSALQVMETLLLAKINGVRFNIVPLLEERKSLKLAGPIFLELFEQRAWRDEIWEQTDHDLTRMIKILKVQFAHSDNMRRAGLPVARGTIMVEANELPRTFEEEAEHILNMFVADRKITEGQKEHILAEMKASPTAFEPQQHHGGSECDTARGGVRSSIAFSKDANLAGSYESTQQGGDNPEIRFLDRFKRRITTLISRNALELARKKKGVSKPWNSMRASALLEAIDLSMKDYNENHYGPHNQLGRVMAEAGFYRENQTYNTPASRADVRGGSGGITAIKPDTSPIQPEKIRTIGFTSTGMDMSVGFAVLPMRNMMSYIENLYASRADLRNDLQREAGGQDVFNVKEGKFTPLGLKTLYDVEPVYRAAVADFPAFGVAITNLPLTVKLLKQRSAPKVSQETMDYFEKSLPLDIVGVAVPYLMAKGYEIPEKFISKDELANPTPEICAKLGMLIREVSMQHISEQLVMTSRFSHLSRVIRESVFAKAMQTPDAHYTPIAGYIWRLTGILRGMFGHQVFDGAADYPIGVKRIARRPSHEPELQPKAYYALAA